MDPGTFFRNYPAAVARVRAQWGRWRDLSQDDREILRYDVEALLQDRILLDRHRHHAGATLGPADRDLYLVCHLLLGKCMLR